MFENYSAHQFPNVHLYSCEARNVEMKLIAAIANEFEQALISSFLRRIGSAITRRSNRLLCLAHMNLHVLSACSAGIRIVPITAICGTESKVDDFDAAFNPVHPRSRSRWTGIAITRIQGNSLPPVELIQVGDIYFVRDGHHRISVARAMGQENIEAEVIVWQVEETELPKKSTWIHNQNRQRNGRRAEPGYSLSLP